MVQDDDCRRRARWGVGAWWANPYAQPEGSDWLFITLFASVFTIGPFLTQLQALRTLSAFTVNLSYNLEPLYSIALAMLLFNEAQELNLSFWMGVSMIVAAVGYHAVCGKRSVFVKPDEQR